jgi:glyoxylase-like metal-dependent hydrolase (beta-lactamase superfamily II)
MENTNKSTSKLTITIAAALAGCLSLPTFAAIKDTCELTPRWNSKTVYKADEHIQYAGKAYQAKWWNKDKTPNPTNLYSAWQPLRECLAQTSELIPLPVGEGKEHSFFEQIAEDDPYIDVFKVHPGIYAINETFIDMEFESVTAYLIIGTKQAVLFDSGLGLGNLKKIVDQLTDKPILLVNSHYHYDHVAANADFPFIMAADDEYTRKGEKGLNNADLIDFLKIAYGPFYQDVGPDYYMRPYEVDIYLRDKTKINLGGTRLEVITAPGHSPDAIVLLDEERKLMYTGDVFYQSNLFGHLPESDTDSYYQSAQKLKALQHKVERVLPNHSVPMADGHALTEMGDAFAAIKAGMTPIGVDNGLVFYPFEKFSVILKQEL